MAEETPTTNPSVEQVTTETPPVKPSNKLNPVEIVANPDFIDWKYPPYCELCSVHFTSESNSKLHFDGSSHKNRLQAWKKYQDPASTPTTSKSVLCKVCWKEMNTQAVMDTHVESPAHKKAEKDRLIVQKLKDEYRQLKESQ